MTLEELPPWVRWDTVLHRLGISHKVRSTGNVIAPCVFHRERTPSLFFWRKGFRFHCFGCGTEGTIIDFVNSVLYAEPESKRIEVLTT
jgi:DNA primase